MDQVFDVIPEMFVCTYCFGGTPFLGPLMGKFLISACRYNFCIYPRGCVFIAYFDSRDSA